MFIAKVCLGKHKSRLPDSTTPTFEAIAVIVLALLCTCKPHHASKSFWVKPNTVVSECERIALEVDVQVFSTGFKCIVNQLCHRTEDPFVMQL